MLSIPSAAEPILMSLSIAFTQPTFQRILPLTVGRRTITAVLWTMRGLLSGHPSTYHRVFSRAVWSLWPLGRVLAGKFADGDTIKIDADQHKFSFEKV